MKETNKSVRTCSAVAMLGGLVAIACMALTYAPGEDTITVISFYMLVSVLYFALAGAFTRNSQWNASLTVVITFMTLGIIIVAAMYGSFSYNVAMVLGIFGLVILIASVLPSVKSWLDRQGI